MDDPEETCLSAELVGRKARGAAVGTRNRPLPTAQSAGASVATSRDLAQLLAKSRRTQLRPHVTDAFFPGDHHSCSGLIEGSPCRLICR
jgi:hypothetical protein